AHVQSDVRDLGIGVGAPGNHQVVQPLVRTVQCIGHGHACGRHRHVGETVCHAGIASRVDRRVVRAKVLVDVDAAGDVVGYAGRVQPHVVDARNAAGADQD